MASKDHPDRKSFAALLADVKLRIQTAQTRAMLAVNSELVRLYWDIGRMINARQNLEGWGSGVIPRLAAELKNEMPELKGFSERNIKRMLAFYRDYRDPAAIVPQAAAQLSSDSSSTSQPAGNQSVVILPQAVAKLAAQGKKPLPSGLFDASLLWAIPWFHHVVLMEKVKDRAARRWYMERTLANGWSRNILAMQIDAQAHARRAAAAREQRRREEEEERQRRIHAMPFPKPPIPGTADIVPLTSSCQLSEEGRTQMHCVGGMTPLVKDRAYYVYKILQPERETLAIMRWSDGSWGIAELKLVKNQKVQPATKAHVKAWLDKYRVSI